MVLKYVIMKTSQIKGPFYGLERGMVHGQGFFQGWHFQIWVLTVYIRVYVLQSN